MRKPLLLFIISIFIFLQSQAGRITGIVSDNKGNTLAYASIFIKGTTKGTTANNEGKYFLNLDAGEYIIVAQFVGYQRQEKKITVGNETITLNFQLSLLDVSLKEVVVKTGGEDPAYEIIRNAIKKKKDYRQPLDSFTCEAYIKTLIKTRKFPKKILGQKIEENDRKDMGLDSAGKGIIFLSESLTKIAFKKPDKTKLEVLSGRESGSSGYGFNFPTFINFYNDNVNVFTSQLNPRGFISPIADAAMNYYRFKFLGSFFEDGKEINQIKVIARRKYEPLFNGTIYITEGDWRIHSLELNLTKESQLELLDTISIKQMHVPINKDVWRTKDQVVNFTFNMFGIDAVGNFINVYNKYDTEPAFTKNYFNNVVMKYDTAVNKKTKSYWDSIRPVQLEPEEIKDYKIKDSAFQYKKDSVWSKRNVDSMRKGQGKITLTKIFWSGFTRSNFNPKNLITYTWEPVVQNLHYNTVEGVAANLEATIRKSFTKAGKQLSITPHIRYGFSNGHLNAWATMRFSKQMFTWNDEGGNMERYYWTFAGGKRINQFNKENPITPLMNSIYTLLMKQNYMKLYENYFGEINYAQRFDNGLRFNASVLYEDRLPLNNTTNFSIFKYPNRSFTPNYPFEKINNQFTRHQALITGVEVQFKPGQRYIQFPRSKMAIGSKYPTLAVQYQKGIKALGSDVNFDKWRITAWDDVNLKLRGKMRYRFHVGGFINNKKVFIQDYQHFNGNQLFFAGEYLNSFQIAPYYANSSTASFYTVAHVEHHFNGFITNKIPLFRRLNWYLVGGSNAFYVNRTNNYVEVFGGIENIFKLLRVDVVASYLNGKEGQVGVRLGLGGLLASSIRIDRR